MPKSVVLSATESMAFCTSSRQEIAAARSLVIAAGGGRDLDWPHQRVAAELLARSGGRPVQLVLHGGARGADAAIGRAAHQLGWSSLVMPAEWQRHGRAAGPIRNANCWSRRLPGRWPTPSRARSPRCWSWLSPAAPAPPRWCSRPAAWPPAPRCRSPWQRSAHRLGSGLFLPPPAPEGCRAIERSVLSPIHSFPPHCHGCSHPHPHPRLRCCRCVSSLSGRSGLLPAAVRLPLAAGHRGPGAHHRHRPAG